MFDTVGRVLGGVDRDTGIASAILDEAAVLPETWMCYGWWLCVLGQFAAASVAYRTAAGKAADTGNGELVQIAQTSRVASYVLAVRIEPADSPALRAINRDLSDPSPELAQAVVNVKTIQVLAMAESWLGLELATQGFEHLPRVPEVAEVNSPLELYLRGYADAVALKNATNAEQVAAQLGNERRQIAEQWIERHESYLESLQLLANILGLRENDRGSAHEEREINIKSPG